MDIATIIYVLGFALVLAGELISIHDDVPRNTITARLKWIMGIGRKITVWFFISRIIVLGFIVWWLLHTAGSPV